MTPEGRVKAAVKRELDVYESHYREMPVPGGYGKSGLDFTVCFFGHYLAIETKAPGNKPTDRQMATMRAIERAGGITAVVTSTDEAKGEFRSLLKHLANYPVSPVP